MGLIPEVAGTLVGCIDDIEVGRLHELIEQNQEKKTLVAFLKALQAAYNIRKQVPDIPFKGIQVDLKLGWPPHVAVKFLSVVPAAVAGAGVVTWSLDTLAPLTRARQLGRARCILSFAS